MRIRCKSCLNNHFHSTKRERLLLLHFPVFPIHSIIISIQLLLNFPVNSMIIYLRLMFSKKIQIQHITSIAFSKSTKIRIRHILLTQTKIYHHKAASKTQQIINQIINASLEMYPLLITFRINPSKAMINLTEITPIIQITIIWIEMHLQI